MSKHTPDRAVVVGVAWFDRKQWKRLTEAVEDRNELDDTYLVQGEGFAHERQVPRGIRDTNNPKAPWRIAP